MSKLSGTDFEGEKFAHGFGDLILDEGRRVVRVVIVVFGGPGEEVGCGDGGQEDEEGEDVRCWEGMDGGEGGGGGLGVHFCNWVGRLGGHDPSWLGRESCHVDFDGLSGPGCCHGEFDGMD